MRRIRGLKLRSFLVLGLAAVGSCSARDTVVGRLELAQTDEFVIPDSLAVVGAAASGEGASWIWQARTPSLGFVKRGRSITWHNLTANVAPIAVFEATPDILEIVDGETGAIGTRRTRTGQETWATTRLGTTYAASRTSKGTWFLHTRDSTSDFLWIARRGDLPRQILSIPASGGREDFSLSTYGESALLSFADPKGGLVIVDSTGQRVEMSKLFEDNELASLLADTAAMWRSLGTYQIETELLLVLSNFKGSERLLVSLDSSGRVLRSTRVRAAISFAATDQRQKRALVFRRLNKTALVNYAWRRVP
jgi:hypothetical protein